MEEITNAINLAIASAGAITVFGSYALMWMLTKIFTVISSHSKGFKKFFESKDYRMLKPIYPILFGCLIGILTFTLIDSDVLVIAILKGGICGMIAEKIYHVWQRRLKMLEKPE